MMKTTVLGITAAVAATISATSARAVDQTPHAVMMVPDKALELKLGDHHAISYFSPGDGVCGLTVVMASSQGNAPQSEEHGTRLKVGVAPGHTLNIDGTQQQSIEFACRPGGAKMTARAYKRPPFKAAAKTE